mmetsp:Transcript_9389/g.19079  ORF Transcript_9389/g.19079 Transcript_9389/m.19079 type:complete len:356 (-) Transcript_9389:1289-2356(-)
MHGLPLLHLFAESEHLLGKGDRRWGRAFEVVDLLPFPLPEIDHHARSRNATVVDSSKGKGVPLVFSHNAEGCQIMLNVRLELGIHGLGPLLSLLQEGVDVLVRECSSLRLQNLVRAKRYKLHHLVLIHVLALLCQSPLLYDSCVKEKLPVRTLGNLLLDRALGNKPEHLDWLLLSDPVGAVHGLEVDLRVPVGVVKDDNVRGLEVDSQTTGPRGEEERELRGVIFVERVHLLVPLVPVRVAVDPAVLVADVVHVVLEDVENPSHLGEDQNPAAVFLELGKELVENLHLSSVLPKVRSIVVGRSRLCAREKVRVVADLAELHEDVLEAGLCGTSHGVQLDRLLLKDLGVVLDLHVR